VIVLYTYFGLGLINYVSIVLIIICLDQMRNNRDACVY
jgi:hypothetical protein